MSKQELLERLKECAENSDTEQAHVEADDLLLNFINDPEIAAAYHAVSKWYA